MSVARKRFTRNFASHQSKWPELNGDCLSAPCLPACVSMSCTFSVSMRTHLLEVLSWHACVDRITTGRIGIHSSMNCCLGVMRCEKSKGLAEQGGENGGKGTTARVGGVGAVVFRSWICWRRESVGHWEKDHGVLRSQSLCMNGCVCKGWRVSGVG